MTLPRARLRPGKYNSPEILNRVATLVYEAAQKEGARVALIGGFAMQLYDAPYLTRDLDFVADKIVYGIGSGGDVEVNIIIRSDEYKALYEEALLHAEGVREGIEGLSYPVVSPEYLVVMKMVGRRRKDSEHLSFLLTDVELDWANTEKISLRHLGPHSVKMLRDLRKEAQWRKEEGR